MRYFLLVLAVIFLPLFLSFFINFLIFYKRYGRLPYGNAGQKRQSFLRRIYLDFPARFCLDMFERDKDVFPDSGLHLIVGEQGSGKTICLTQMLLDYQARYDKLKVRTNYNYKHQDGEIKSWKDLVFKNNGIYGEIDVIDEIQNWFNSLQSKDFPPEMFGEITQQRKQRKMIIGTSQVWQRVAKPIREQCRFVYKPITLFGCITVVRKYKPCVNDQGSIDKLNFRGMYFFVHSNVNREAFDTYHKIQVMSLKGFKPDLDRVSHAAAALVVPREDRLSAFPFGSRNMN